MLDNDVHAFFVSKLFHLFRDFLLVMVDPMVSTQPTRLLQFLFISCRCNHARLKQFGDLNSCDADTRTGAQDEHGLPRTNSGASYQHVPGRKEHQRHTGGLVEIQVVGNWYHTHGGRCHQFAVSTIDEIASHGEFGALVLKPGNAFRTMIAEMHRRQ